MIRLSCPIAIRRLLRIKLYCFILLSCFFLSLPRAAAHHSDKYTQEVLQLILVELVAWLENQGRFNKKNVQPPEIAVIHDDDMCQMAYGENVIEHGINCNNILGLYNFINKTIYIVDSLNLDSVYGKSIILHELVHHYQYECNYDDSITCLADLEPLSYELEKKYFKDEAQQK
jgi:hypothetical protein